MMKALVTGAGGFCGKHLVRYLQEQGIEVHTLSPTAGVSPHRHRLQEITDIGALASILKSVRPDYVFHLSGVTQSPNPNLFYRVNTQYAVALFSALEVSGLGDCPVLIVGTSAEYGIVTNDQLPVREDLPPQPSDHYGISKLAQTFESLAVSRNGKPVVIVRPFNVIGPGMPDFFVVQSFATQIVKILKGEMPPVIRVGNLASSRDFIDVMDLVRIYWHLLNKSEAYGQVVNICSGKDTRIGDLLSKLRALSGITVQVNIDHSRLKPIDISVHYGSTEKLQKIIGYVPNTNLDALLRSILETLRRQ